LTTRSEKEPFAVAGSINAVGNSHRPVTADAAGRGPKSTAVVLPPQTTTPTRSPGAGT
jgi:hypothetical protein